MPSSEKVISPGVFTNEIDQSFLPAAVQEIGAALVGPTLKGPALQPTVISSFGEFEDKFGTSFKTGSGTSEYLTSLAAREYLKNSNTLTVVRVLSNGSSTNFSAASANVHTGSLTGPGGNSGSRTYPSAFITDDAAHDDDASATSFKLHTLSHGSLLNNRASIIGSGSRGGIAVTTAPNTNHFTSSNAMLSSGSKDNFRWEITDANIKKGTFSLIIRRGDDTIKRKKILETWNEISLDPNQNNYISKRIGDQYFTLQDSGNSEPYLKLNGDYPNKSKYVRVETIKQTPDYIDENGDIRLNSLTGSLPGLGSGSMQGTFTGGADGWIGIDAKGSITGDAIAAGKVIENFENISATNTQGFDLSNDDKGKTAYEDALNLLKNQDEFDINLILMPGICSGASNHTNIATTAIDLCEDRGDCFVLLDPTLHGKNISDATTEAETRNTNYAAMYWPWVKVQSQNLGRQVWVPPSTVMGGVFAFNDRVAHPWFAPAGLNRGGLPGVSMAERKLTHKNRDTLYDSSVNPIATFPGQGVTAWGQKTLQKKASALDRINVRRLLIKLKKFIASSSRFLVFEQNNTQTRKRFLNIVNPFLEQVQSNSGLTSFSVVMDDTNNTADVVDRNILYGQIFIQPTRTAEFIVLDFTIQPTGATFPD